MNLLRIAALLFATLALVSIDLAAADCVEDAEDVIDEAEDVVSDICRSNYCCSILFLVLSMYINYSSKVLLFNCTHSYLAIT